MYITNGKRIFKIGDEVTTTKKHDELYKFSFKGVIDDIQSSIVIVYGNVTNGLGKANDKYLRHLHVQELELLDEWFEEVCWVCEKVKLVHDDERATLIDPGFICEDCEDERKSVEKFLGDLLF